MYLKTSKTKKKKQSTLTLRSIILWNTVFRKDVEIEDIGHELTRF